MIVSTGKLTFDLGELQNSDGDAFACGHYLDKLFDIPRAKAYWFEVSDKPQRGEWIKATLTLESDGDVTWQAEGWYGWFYPPAIRFLRRHFKLSEKPKRLWCRLVYED